MKRSYATVLLLMVLLLMVSACSGGREAGGQKANGLAVSPTPTLLPGGVPNGSPEATAMPTPAATQEQKSKLYDPSIFVIEASGDWQEEVAPSYFVNYHVDIYLQKIDQNDNRRTEGSYDGVFYMNMQLDANGFFSEMIGDAPFEMQFNGGGEAVADNLALSLNTPDDKAWTDYSILDENGNPLPLTQDTPVSKGSFVVMSRNIYIAAHGRGESVTLDYEDAKSQGNAFDVNYVIHAAPDTAESGNTRKVTILISGEGFSHTIEGTMRRLPGYLEDVNDYFNSPEYQNNPARSKLGGE